MAERNLKEEVNTVGSGAIAGVGVGPSGEPGVNPKNKLVSILMAMLKRKPDVSSR